MPWVNWHSFAKGVGADMLSVDALPLCIGPLVDLLQLIHHILLARIVRLPAHI